jgi:outer membrane lipopolysaccharide assembly protein LptE/RlpB
MMKNTIKPILLAASVLLVGACDFGQADINAQKNQAVALQKYKLAELEEMSVELTTKKIRNSVEGECASSTVHCVPSEYPLL